MTPTTGILDDFNRGSGTGLGANWTALYNRIDLITNEAGGSNNAANLSFYNVTTYGPDCEAYISIPTLPAEGNGVAVYVRLKDTGSLLTVDGYLLVYRRVAGTDEFHIGRIDNVVETQLGATFTQEVSAGDGILLRAVGDQLTAEYWNGISWTVLATRTDATYGAAGYLGLSVENTLARLDNFGGGTYVAPSGDIEDGAGEVNGSTSITGSAQVEASASGLATTSTSISGTAQLEASASGQVSTSTQITGTAQLEASASGENTSSTLIVGQSEVVHDSVGVGAGQGTVSGLVEVVHDASGLIEGSTAITGDGDIYSGPLENSEGQINGDTTVSASSEVLLSASGLIDGSTVISGTGQVVSATPELQEIDDPEMNLLLNIQEFSKIACLDGRVYGVISKCDTCGLTLNDCVRSHLITALEANQAIVERVLGYNLTTHYHEEIHQWDGYSRIQTNWPGVAALNVKQQISSIPDYGPYSISPYVQENLVLTDSGFGYCVATVSREFIENPSHLIIRDDNGHIYETDNVDGYPRRSGENWLIALAGRPEAPACSATLHAQSCKYMYVDVDEHDCGTNSTLTPVYPNTNTPIPQIKESEALAGSLRRFWFSPWVLVDPAFYGEEVNLEVGEFYKLLPEIEFKCVQEVAALPEITAIDLTDCTDEFQTLSLLTTTDTQWDLLNQEYGVTQMQIKNSAFCQNNKAPFRVKIFYKTTPETFHIDQFLASIKEAIAYLTAAELPTEVCGCEIKTGFIATAQKAYTEVRVNPITGESIHNLKHGNLYGQLVFTEKLRMVPRFQRLTRV